jgi:hypothetical protein
MKRTALMVLFAAAGSASAQQETPHLGYVYPAGGQQGTTIRVVVGGQHLNGASVVTVSGNGVEARVVDYLRPLNQGAFKMIQGRMKELAGKENRTAEDEERVAEMRDKMKTFYIRQSSAPALVETVTLEVSVAADAEPGGRSLRILAGQGLSNPLVFDVGQLPEQAEVSGRGVAAAASRSSGRRRRPPEGTEKPLAGTIPVADASAEAIDVELPVTLNGQILPGDTDRYRFRAKEGERLVFDVRARRLIPYLSDAVPGWFQATVTLFDGGGSEVAYADDFRFHPDPVLRCEIPRNGEYVLEIRDALHRGREDFVYRIAIGEGPYIESIFPLGGRAGDEVSLELSGWNLPETNRLVVVPPEGQRSIRVGRGGLISNRVPFDSGVLPERFDAEPNNDVSSAQQVVFPETVNGRIDAPGDMDLFWFNGRAGRRIVAEVKARRLNSPLDSALMLSDASGRQIAFSDDVEDPGSGLITHHADSRLLAILPQDGRYTLYLVDEQQSGGPDFGYRLSLTEAQPGFDLCVTPSAVNARPGTGVPVTVHAMRWEGFDGEIELSLSDAPEGLQLCGGCVPAGQDSVRMTLHVPEAMERGLYDLQLSGRARISGRSVKVRAVPADDVMQAFIYRHLVPAEAFHLCVFGAVETFEVEEMGSGRITLRPGGSAKLSVDMPDRTSWGEVELELSNPPPGISIQSASVDERSGRIVFQCDRESVVPGIRGNLIVHAYAVRDPETMKGRGQRKKPRRLLTALPAISFRIVE